MAFGMVFLLSMGEIDLSVGAIFGLAIVIAAKLMAGGMSPWLAAALTLLIGAGLGALNGVLSNLLQISTLIVTLGTLSSYTAFGLILTHDATITSLPVTNSFFAKFGGGIGVIPTAVLVCVGALIVCQIIYRFTRFGFKVRAIGSNKDAARVAGISVERVRLQALMMQGFLAALIGVTVLANIEAADPTSGNGYELSVIAAAIIGGTALSGGSGTVIGALVGVSDHRRHHDWLDRIRAFLRLGQLRNRCSHHLRSRARPVDQSKPSSHRRGSWPEGDSGGDRRTVNGQEDRAPRAASFQLRNIV